MLKSAKKYYATVMSNQGPLAFACKLLRGLCSMLVKPRTIHDPELVIHNFPGAQGDQLGCQVSH